MTSPRTQQASSSHRRSLYKTTSDGVMLSPAFEALLPLIGTVLFVAAPFVFPFAGGYPPNLFPIPQDQPPVQPAGYAFSIWGLIYSWLLVSTIFGFLKRSDSADWSPARIPLAISLVLGAAWIPLSQHTPIGATAVILLMSVAAATAFVRSGSQDRWLQRAIYGLFSGWVTAASSVSVGLVLGGWGVLSENAAAIVAILLAGAFGAVVHLKRPQEITYPAGIVWGLVGIIVQNIIHPDTLIVVVASVGAVFLVALTLWTLLCRPECGDDSHDDLNDETRALSPNEIASSIQNPSS